MYPWYVSKSDWEMTEASSRRVRDRRLLLNVSDRLDISLGSLDCLDWRVLPDKEDGLLLFLEDDLWWPFPLLRRLPLALRLRFPLLLLLLLAASSFSGMESIRLDDDAVVGFGLWPLLLR